MEKTIIKFGGIETQKQKFHQYKGPILIKIQMLMKQQNLIRSLLVKKYLNIFLATKMIKKVRLLDIFIPKRSAYRRDFDETKQVFFLIKDDKLLEKYNEICKKVNSSLEKEFDSEPVYNKKFLNATIKSHNGEINTNFYNNKIQEKVLNLFVYQ